MASSSSTQSSGHTALSASSFSSSESSNLVASPSNSPKTSTNSHFNPTMALLIPFASFPFAEASDVSTLIRSLMPSAFFDRLVIFSARISAAFFSSIFENSYSRDSHQALSDSLSALSASEVLAVFAESFSP